MVILVVCINVVVAVMLLVLAVWVWQLQYRLARAAVVLARAERSTHRALHHAPDAIRQGQLGVHELHQSLQRLEKTVGLVQQGTAVLGFSLSFLRRRAYHRARSVRS